MTSDKQLIPLNLNTIQKTESQINGLETCKKKIGKN